MRGFLFIYRDPGPRSPTPGLLSGLVVLRLDELRQRGPLAIAAIVERGFVERAVSPHDCVQDRVKSRMMRMYTSMPLTNDGILLGTKRTYRPRLRHPELGERPLRAEVFGQQPSHEREAVWAGTVWIAS